MRNFEIAMRLESKALQMSLVIHALLLVLVMIFSKDTLNAQKVVVIDLTLIDHVNADAGSSGNKKAKDQKTALKEIPRVIEQKKEKVKEEKKEIQVKNPTDDEKILIEEQVPPVETVSIEQESEEHPVSENHVVNEHSDTFLAGAQTADASMSRGGDVPGTNTKQDLGGGAGAVDGVMKGYLRSHLSYIKEMIQENIAYPNIARQNGWTGKVTVSFIIAYTGRVRDIQVVRSSGFGCLDKNAVEAVKRSSPFPQPPLEARIIIPILYELH
jgi:TonB family protein